MSDELFSDGIGEIVFENGVFRIDLVSFSATRKNKEGKPVLVFRQRILMPPDSFLRSFSSMERIVKKMVANGVIKRTKSPMETEASTEKEVPPSFS